MRVVQFVTQERGGPVDHAVDVARELARLGHESHLVTPDPDLESALAGTTVRVHVAAIRDKFDVAGARAVSRTISSIRPDVLHCQDRRAGLVGRLLALRHEIGTVYTLHGVPDPLADLVPGNLRLVAASRTLRSTNFTAERWLSRIPRSRVVTPCEAISRYARDHVGVAPERVVTVHNGIDEAWGAEGTSYPRPPADQRTTTVAWLGVMAPVKRVPALVRAAASVPGVRLLLIGDGPERGRVEETMAAAGSDDRVELVGFDPDPAGRLRGADLLALPSAAEACPMAILQAMSCGLPVVASRAGGIPEVVRDGIDGLLVPTGDDGALAAALRTLHDDPAMRRAMGESARLRAAGQFSLTRCTQNLMSVYEEVAP
ncbi:glycosyltransferase involved in cell wall biosynthesis [Nocardioides daedukensis]|uniref:Glycosyltransferase involved in cell wall biosynthesis n=1 Tax=Nocardioides daedukensis TaxID=634462 RepID=A0A7Y9RXL6_9ACTN|nr:glycosyltransferase family 4 protein [Nocardioides daedukensis]NYG58551.1 glycosyltransferase involved in cell wall biosynthesis [Nocardioides daedukensis]